MSMFKAALMATALTIVAAVPASAQEKVPLRVMNGDGVLIDEGGFLFTGKITEKGKTMMTGAKKGGFVIMMHDGKMIVMPVATSREAREMLSY